MTRLGPLVVIVVAMLILAAVGSWRTAAERATWARPAPLPAAAAEPWMVDALPGIGPVTAPTMCAAVRAGNLAALPAAARPLAAQIFALDAGTL